jgi:ankyrin repeat protein
MAKLHVNRRIGVSLLHIAASKGHDKVVAYLIDNGAEINAWT